MAIVDYAAASNFRRFERPEHTHISHADQKTLFFETSQRIYCEGERFSSIYRVNAGAVRVYRILPDGRRHILSFHSSGDWFGLQNGEFREDFAEAICDSQLLRFPSSEPAVLPVSLLALTMKTLAFARERQLALVCQSAIGRVAAFILEMADHFGCSKFELFISRRDVADYLGLAVESVARSFTRLAASRAIHLEGRSHRIIRILSTDKLRALID